MEGGFRIGILRRLYYMPFARRTALDFGVVRTGGERATRKSRPYGSRRHRDDTALGAGQQGCRIHRLLARPSTPGLAKIHWPNGVGSPTPADRLVRQVGAELGQDDGVLVFDPSAFPKQGKESVGTRMACCSNRVLLGRVGGIAYGAGREYCQRCRTNVRSSGSPFRGGSKL
jgi:hypothetical protein